MPFGYGFYAFLSLFGLVLLLGNWSLNQNVILPFIIFLVILVESLIVCDDFSMSLGFWGQMDFVSFIGFFLVFFFFLLFFDFQLIILSLINSIIMNIG